MNILLHAPTYPPHLGGAEVVAHSLAVSLEARAHSVTVVTETEAADAVNGPPVLITPVLRPRIVGEAHALGWNAAQLVRRRIDAVVVSRLEHSSRRYLTLRQIIRFRLVLHLHGDELRVRARSSSRYRWLARWALRRADAVIAVSDRLADEAARFAPRCAERLWVIPNAIDPAALESRSTVTRARPYFLFCGRLEAVKHPSLAVAAFARGGHVLADYDLVIVGDGSQGRALEAQARALGVADRVELRGAVPRPEALGWLASAQALVLPSRAEGHPLVVLEARALGVPVLASDIGGLRDAVPGDAGALFSPPDDPEALAALMIAEATRQRASASSDARSIHGDYHAWVGRHLATINGSRPTSRARSAAP